MNSTPSTSELSARPASLAKWTLAIILSLFALLLLVAAVWSFEHAAIVSYRRSGSVGNDFDLHLSSGIIDVFWTRVSADRSALAAPILTAFPHDEKAGWVISRASPTWPKSRWHWIVPDGNESSDRYRFGGSGLAATQTVRSIRIAIPILDAVIVLLAWPTWQGIARLRSRRGE